MEKEKIKYFDKYFISIKKYPTSRNLYYKNQLFEGIDILPYFCSIIIFGYPAKEVLELNRNKVKKEFIYKHHNEILKYIYLKIEKHHLEDLSNIVKENIYFFYFENEDKLLEISKNDKEIIPEKFAKIQKFMYNYEFKKNSTLTKLINQKEIIIKSNNNIIFFNNIEYELNNVSIEEKFLILLLKIIIKKNRYNVTLDKNNNLKLEKLEENEKYNHIDIDYPIEEIRNNPPFNNRFYIYCNKRFKKLKLREKITNTESFKWIHLYKFLSDKIGSNVAEILETNNILLFPFFMRGENTAIWNEEMRESYIKYCYQNRAYEELSIEEFEKEVDKFIEYLKVEFKKIGIEIKNS